jgi:YidC/Oxa1 family membrane protein insertase
MKPLYNGFIVLISSFPFLDAGVIIVIFTVIIKTILLPLSIKASKAQIEMKSIDGDIQKIKEKYKDNKEEQSRKIIDLYREKNINPFASIFILLIQLPIIIGLYQVFLKSGLPSIDTTLLYSFISSPVSVNMTFLNILHLADKSVVIAIIAGVTAYFQMKLSSENQTATATKDSENDFSKAMAVQMKYVFPIIMVFIAYSISSVIGLYLITSNIFAIFQEMYIKRKYHTSVLVA